MIDPLLRQQIGLVAQRAYLCLKPLILATGYHNKLISACKVISTYQEYRWTGNE